MFEDGQLLNVVLIALAAGMAMPVGALLAFNDAIQPRWLEQEIRHGVIALGAGCTTFSSGIGTRSRWHCSS